MSVLTARNRDCPTQRGRIVGWMRWVKQIAVGVENQTGEELCCTKTRGREAKFSRLVLARDVANCGTQGQGSPHWTSTHPQILHSSRSSPDGTRPQSIPSSSVYAAIQPSPGDTIFPCHQQKTSHSFSPIKSIQSYLRGFSSGFFSLLKLNGCAGDLKRNHSIAQEWLGPFPSPAYEVMLPECITRGACF